MELRFKIYEMVAPKTTLKKMALYGEDNDNPCRAITLMSVCRQFREEVRQFFYKYNFDLWPLGKNFEIPHPDLAAHVREIIYHWSAKVKDARYFNKLSGLPQLKILNLNLANFRVYAYVRGNKTYQDNENIRPYSQQAGFDNLVKLRALESVKVYQKHKWSSPPVQCPALVAFETFLNSVLTLPKPPARQVSSH